VDEIIVDDKRGEHRGLSGLWRQALRLRQKNFSLALTPHKSLRSALILYLARIPCRIGFRQSHGWFLFHRRVERRAELHDVERNLSLLQAFGIAPAECARDYGLRLPHCAAPAVQELRGLKSRGHLLIGINPGSVWATKRWQADGFAQLVRLLRARGDCEVAIFGGPDDLSVASAIERNAGGGCVNYAGRFSLGDLPQALAACDLLITNDSGPMHIAVALGVPTVAVFCATTPELGFYPYSSAAIIVQKDLACRPCGTHGGRRCPLGTEDCMRLIDAGHVMQAVEKLLHQRGRKNAADEHVPESLTF
jgi:heptosyltransferase-2